MRERNWDKEAGKTLSECEGKGGEMLNLRLRVKNQDVSDESVAGK